jgi:DNA-binding GntR family transcriptional regulator
MSAPRQAPPIVALEQTPSLEDRLTEQLRKLISSGALLEGTPLRLRDVAERFGVSPTPVRTSLSRLEQDGLVVIGRTGRAMVSPLTLEDVEEIYAARRGMEALAARRGAPLLHEDDLREMAALLKELHNTADPETLDTYLDVNWRFHERCYRASSRVRLVDEVGRLYWRAVRYYRMLLSTDRRLSTSVSFHERFYDACQARDGRAAALVVENGLRWSVERLARTLADRPSDQPLIHLPTAAKTNA